MRSAALDPPTSKRKKAPNETIAMATFSALINEIQDTTVSGSTKKQLSALKRITDLFVTGSVQTGAFDRTSSQS